MARGDLPESVRLADGRIEPFEPERIARSLFAVGERLRRPDAFQARELTDGVLHFLATEEQAPVTTPDRIAEVVGKVVRELGQPAIALAYEERGRSPSAPRGPEPARLPDWASGPASVAQVHLELARPQLRAFSLRTVFPRDLVSAHEEGLLRLTGLEHPRELEGIVANLAAEGASESVAAARGLAGGYIAVDGPEYDLAPLQPEPTALADSFLRPLGFAAQTLGVRVILNLNVGTPPPRSAGPSGPLFHAGRDEFAERRREIAVALADQASNACFDVWWHVPAEADHPPAVPTSVLARAAAGGPTEFVVDRTRVPIALGPGVDRRAPGGLICVGLDLARLVELAGGPPVDPDVLLRKLGSLTRFAKTAGHVKQDFLRRHGRPEVRAAFLLDRARVVLAPYRLAAAACVANRAPVEFAREVLRTIRTAAETDRPRAMPVWVAPTLDAGVWEALFGPAVSVPRQIWAGNQLLGATGAGRLELVHPDRRPFVADEVADAVRLAAESAVPRIHFGHP